MIPMDDEVREQVEEQESQSERKSISVKGVKKDVYKRMIQLARDSGRTLGELTNDAYRTFIGTIDGARNVSQSFMEGTVEGKKGSRIISIENFRNLKLSKKDLEEIGHKVEIRNIDDLDLSDINDEMFDKYVHSITGIKNLTISSSLKKSKILLKARFVDNIIQKK